MKFSIFKTKRTVQVILVYKRTGLTTAISRKVDLKVELTVLQRNLREWHATLAQIYVCECYWKVKKVGSTAIVSGTVNWSYPILPFGIVVCTFFRQLFSK